MAGVTFIDSFVDEFGDEIYIDEEGRQWQLLDGEFLDDITDDGLDHEDVEDDGGSYAALNRFE